jgi:hypothetical protein
MTKNPKKPLSATLKPQSEITDTVAISRPTLPGQASGQEGEQTLHVRGEGTVSKKLTANPRDEYVSGGGYVWLPRYIKALPFYIDDTSRDFGNDIYDRMMLDPQTSAAIDVRKAMVLAQGIKIVPIDDETEKGADGQTVKQPSPLSQEIADFCNAVIGNLDRPLINVMWEMLDALALGHQIAELIYHIPVLGSLSGRLALRAVKVKPRTSATFVVDVYFNCIGIIGLIPGQGAPVIVESIIGEPGQIPNLLPREKFAVYSHQMKDNDPRGRSCLRRCYNPWYIKQQVWGEWLKYMAVFGGGMIVGTTAESAEATEIVDAAGNSIPGPGGQPTMVQPEASMLAAIQELRAGGAMAAPFGSKIEIVQAAETATPYAELMDTCDRQIVKGILWQTLATEEGKHQTRAASGTHQDILGLVSRTDKRETSDMIRRDILFPLVKYNYGEALAIDLTPRVDLGETEHQDFETAALAVSSLVSSGYLHYSQYRGTDELLSLPPRDMEAMMKEIEADAAAVAAAASQANSDAAAASGKQAAGRAGG